MRQTTELNLMDVSCHGDDRGRGNLLGVQPYMLPGDYAGEGSFHAKLDGYLRVAQERGWLNPRSIAIFPEYIGSWLAADNARASVYAAPTLAQVMTALILSHPLRFLRAYLSSHAQDHLRESLFSLNAAAMAAIYQQTFAALAQRYGVTLVAGSILLPAPDLVEGRLRAGEGPLYNVTLVFRPDGAPYPEVVRKVHPIADEQPFVAAGSADGLPVFDAPAGKLGVLVCADSWYPDGYAALRAQEAELLAVPSYLAPDGVWERPWKGYSGEAAPADVDPADACKLTEGQAWLKYALAGRAARAEIRCGMNVFLRGRIWDLGSEGHMVVVREGEVIEAKHVSGAAIVNCWL